MAFKLAPSILSADFGHLERDIQMLNSSEADWIHVDVMDGVFVPNISFGFPILETLKKTAHKPIDVHLMIVDPDRYLSKLAGFAPALLTVHYEACTHLNRTLNEIRKLGMKAGVSLNPHTPVSHLEDILGDADMVLLMSVNPGFSAQKFIDGTYRKIEQLKNMIIRQNLQTLVEVDGGVNLINAKQLADAGADILVAGNAVFSTPDPLETIRKFKVL
ncbi:ribulose-phosphate 3-epimerase [Bacteroidota bacterium]